MIFGLFSRDDVDAVRSSLSELAHRLDLPVESIREAVLVLLADGEYATAADLATLDADEDFELRIDWQKWEDARRFDDD